MDKTIYHRPWPLPPRINQALEDRQFDAAKDELDHWYIICVVVIVALMALSFIIPTIWQLFAHHAHVLPQIREVQA